MSSDAKKLKQSKPGLKTRKGHEKATPDKHAKWAEFIEQIRKELGWTLDETCDFADVKMGWLKKAREGLDVRGDFREKFEIALNKKWKEKFPNKPPLVWPAWVDAAPWAESNSAASPPSVPTEEKIPHNLPEAPSCFFGHKELRQKIAAKLTKKGLIVLHETGGIGKTTLAKQVARDSFQKQLLPGGAVWINCEQTPDINGCQCKMTEVLLGSRMENTSPQDRTKLLNEYFALHHIGPSRIRKRYCFVWPILI